MTDLITSDSPFSAQDKRALAEILGYMIPAEGNRPAASDELIFTDFLRTVTPQAGLVHKVLDLYANTTLEGLSRSSNPAVNALVSFVVQCYYRDDRVMADLDMDVRAPHPQGYDLDDDAEQTWKLLEPVRKRGKIYRDA
jgi:hypothetical protein